MLAHDAARSVPHAPRPKARRCRSSKPCPSRDVSGDDGEGDPADGTYVIGLTAFCGSFGIDCEPGEDPRRVLPDDFINFRSDIDPACVLGSVCESPREF